MLKRFPSIRTRFVAALAAITVFVAVGVVAQETGELDDCFVWCHEGHMEMLDDGWPLFIVEFSFDLCMEHAC